MNFLALCQRVHLLTRIGGDGAPGTQPEHVTAQTDVAAEIVSWVQSAYADLQNDRANWAFMRNTGTLVLPAGQSSRSLAQVLATVTDYAHLTTYESGGWRFINAIPTDELDTGSFQPLHYVPYEMWAGSFDDANVKPDGRPSRFTVDPDGALLFNAKPTADLTLRFDYRRTQHALADDDDLPIIPDEHHMVIVFWAIVRYYCLTRDSSTEFRSKADAELRRTFNRLCQSQLPDLLLET